MPLLMIDWILIKVRSYDEKQVRKELTDCYQMIWHVCNADQYYWNGYDCQESDGFLMGLSILCTKLFTSPSERFGRTLCKVLWLYTASEK